MNPLPLLDAINAVEAASTNLTNADAGQAQAQQKYDAALAAKTAADTADVDAAVAFNAAIDVLVASATAAKRPVTPITVPVPPTA